MHETAKPEDAPVESENVVPDVNGEEGAKEEAEEDITVLGPDEMIKYKRVTPNMAIGPQPTAEALQKHLPKLDFGSVLNLANSEDEGFLANEADLVSLTGKSETQMPLGAACGLRLEDVEKVHKEIELLPGPVFVHCKVGLVACIVVLLLVAKEQNAEGRQVLQWGAQLGFRLADNAAVYRLINEFCSNLQQTA